MPGRVDGSGSIAAELPPLDRAYEIDFRLLSDRLAEIPDDVNGVLKLFDGRRTLAEVLAEADRQGLAAAEVLAKLWSEEIIRPASGTAQGSATPGQGESAPAAAQTDRAEWFEGPADPDPPRHPSTEVTAAEGGGEASVPRIVRFPAKRRDLAVPAGAAPESVAEGAPAPASPLPARPAPQAQSRIAPGRPFQRPSPSGKGARGRSAAALLVAALLAAVTIWRMVATARPPPASSGSGPAQPSQPRGQAGR